MPLFTGNWFGFGAATGSDGPTAFSATGGDLSPQSGTAPGNGYRYHSFGSQGTFTVTGDPHPGVEILCVGGGGAGGARNTGGSDGGAGGGGGGYVLATGVPLTPGTYTVTVGAGGEGSYPSPNGPTPNDYFGEDSVFADDPGPPYGGSLTITAGGGGGGGSGPSRGPVGAAKGCGGGAGGGGGPPPGAISGGESQQPTVTQTGLTPPQFTQAGKNGGSSDHSDPHVGAGGSGVQLPAWTGPLIGAPTLNPHNGYYGGGGGGGSGGVGGSPAVPGGIGGSGGGGNAPPGQAPTQPTFNGQAGGQYVGGGGGAGSGYNTGSPSGSGGAGGDGGTGIVVIRYTI